MTSLSAHIVQFCRYLRQHDYTVGAEDEAISLQSLLLVNYTDPAPFYLALKATLCKNKTQAEAFEAFFNEYWKDERKGLNAKAKMRQSKAQPAPQPPSFKSLKSWLHGNRNEETEETAAYSYHESLSQKNFSSIPNEDLSELKQVIKDLAKRLAAKKKRRYTSSEKDILPDLRRTLRQNLRRGGEFLELAWRKPKHNRIKLVLLCDVSKSMELYTSFLIQFMFAFQQAYKGIETFTFGTRLKRITTLLKDKNFQDTLHLLTIGNDGWEGGTRIGESLDAFIKTYSTKLLGSKTVVVILSDGWDNGNTELLKSSMEFIQRKARKVIWLNPLASFSAFRPEAVGMRTAMPFIDVFASVHNVESLRRLSKWLE